MIDLSSIICGCDPDTKIASYAWVVGSRLVRVEHQDSPFRRIRRSGHVVIEDQAVYSARVRPQDIIRLAQAAGACAMSFDSHEFVSPMVWKRGMDKKRHHAWLETQMSSDELALLAPYNKTQRKELLDAIGIAFWKVGRSV